MLAWISILFPRLAAVPLAVVPQTVFFQTGSDAGDDLVAVKALRKHDDIKTSDVFDVSYFFGRMIFFSLFIWEGWIFFFFQT